MCCWNNKGDLMCWWSSVLVMLYVNFSPIHTYCLLNEICINPVKLCWLLLNVLIWNERKVFSKKMREKLLHNVIFLLFWNDYVFQENRVPCTQPYLQLIHLASMVRILQDWKLMVGLHFWTIIKIWFLTFNYKISYPWVVLKVDFHFIETKKSNLIK